CRFVKSPEATVSMKVSASQPFQIVYSLYLHEYLGFIFESYVVHLDEKGKLTFQHQNISTKNAREFSRGLDDRDFELIEIVDSMQQETVVRRFHNKFVKPEEFFPKVYDKDKGNRSEEHTSELQSRENLVCRLLL